MDAARIRGAVVNALARTLALLLALTAGHVSYEAGMPAGGFDADVRCVTPWSGPVECPEHQYALRSRYGSEEAMPTDLRVHELTHVLDGLDGNRDGLVGRADPHPWPGWGEAARLYPGRDNHCTSTMAEWLACETARTGELNEVGGAWVRPDAPTVEGSPR